QALACVHEALALAHALAHPFSLAFARCFAAYVSQFRRDVPAVHAHAEATVALSTEQGFTQWAVQGMTLRRWALAMQGQGEEEISQVRQGIAAYLATGASVFVAYLYTWLAEVSAHLGRVEDGLQALTEAHTLVEQQEERWVEAGVQRHRGVLLLKQTGTPQEEAETWLRRAPGLAPPPEANSHEAPGAAR